MSSKLLTKFCTQQVWSHAGPIQTNTHEYIQVPPGPPGAPAQETTATWLAATWPPAATGGHGPRPRRPAAATDSDYGLGLQAWIQVLSHCHCHGPIQVSGSVTIQVSGSEGTRTRKPHRFRQSPRAALRSRPKLSPWQSLFNLKY